MKTRKIPVTAIIRINYACKKQRSVKGLKFGDRQNLIDDAISTGVTEDVPACGSMRNMPNYEAPSNAIQHDVLADDDDISEHHEDDIDNITECFTEDNDDESSEENSEYDDKSNDEGNEEVAAVENRSDEVVLVKETTAQPVEQGCNTRSGSLIKSNDHATNFPETSHAQ